MPRSHTSTDTRTGRHIAAIGDVHGHLQLALAVAALWQQEQQVELDAVFLCGDVGCFTDEAQLDAATRRHARSNPIELEFLTQWSATPPAPWLRHIFLPAELGGLGLRCPVVFVHGNHEGFEALDDFAARPIPPATVPVAELPAVDTLGRIQYLPSGWVTELASGITVSGVGGIDPSQRPGPRYHPLAHISTRAVESLLHRASPVDIFLSHQGPAATQGDGHGSPVLDDLAELPVARLWFHGHSVLKKDIRRVGLAGYTQVVPLGGIDFPISGAEQDRPGREGWAWATLEGTSASVDRRAPPWLGGFNRQHWVTAQDGLLVCPPLAGAVA